MKIEEMEMAEIQETTARIEVQRIISGLHDENKANIIIDLLRFNGIWSFIEDEFRRVAGIEGMRQIVVEMEEIEESKCK